MRVGISTANHDKRVVPSFFPLPAGAPPAPEAAEASTMDRNDASFPPPFCSRSSK